MNKETTLQHLIEKAGFYGKLKEIDNKIKMRRYQSIKFLWHMEVNSKLEDVFWVSKSEVKTSFNFWGFYSINIIFLYQ